MILNDSPALLRALTLHNNKMLYSCSNPSSAD